MQGGKMFNPKEKARYWVALMYPENMIDDWKEEIADQIQMPGAYCIHDKDLDEKKEGRKVHVHIIIVFPNTTTGRHALEVFKRLEKPGRCAIPNDCIQSVIGIRHMYDYLIHDTEQCKKKGKYQYSKDERILFNSFDIGAYEQLSAKEKLDMKADLADIIVMEKITNFVDFYTLVRTKFDYEWVEIVTSYSSFFERLTKGNYLKYIGGFKDENKQGSNGSK